MSFFKKKKSMGGDSTDCEFDCKRTAKKPRFGDPVLYYIIRGVYNPRPRRGVVCGGRSFNIRLRINSFVRPRREQCYVIDYFAFDIDWTVAKSAVARHTKYNVYYYTAVADQRGRSRNQCGRNVPTPHYGRLCPDVYIMPDAAPPCTRSFSIAAITAPHVEELTAFRDVLIRGLQLVLQRN